MAKRRRKKREPISEQIRRLIEASEMTRYEIAKRAEIDHSAMSRFMSGERGVSSAALDRIGELMDWEIRQRTDNRR
jgi:transcriptional regulator with XRE-family HTH domain